METAGEGTPEAMPEVSSIEVGYAGRRSEAGKTAAQAEGSEGYGVSRSEPKQWLSFEDALKHTERSAATIKRAIAAGKISKRMVSRPGSRPQLQLWREDLDRVFDGVVHVPAVNGTELIRAEANLTPAKIGDTVHVVRPKAFDPAPEWAADPAPVLDRLEAIFARPEQETLARKLAWTLDEARMMTGLTEPLLRWLIEQKPELAIRHGRRMWIKAEALRKELS